MSDLISFFTHDNFHGIFGVLLAAHGLAVAIVNLTPTPKDDEVLAKIYKIIEFFAGLFTRRVKQ